VFQAQIHLLGNQVVWLAGTASMVALVVITTLYMLRRRRMCFDITEGKAEFHIIMYIFPLTTEEVAIW